MNYQAIYNKLMTRAQNRELTGYTETHHIIPRCLGGKDSPENLAVLTPEEHYLAHLILIKIHPDNHKLLWALWAMSGGSRNQKRTTNKMYGWVKRRFIEMLRTRATGRRHTPETKAKISAFQTGKKRGQYSEETKRKMSEAAKGRVFSDEHRANLAEAQRRRKHLPRTSEWKEKLRLSNIESAKHKDKSIYQSAEYKQKQAKKMKEIWAKRKLGELPLPNHKTP